MTINPNASQMLQAFIEAGQALDELPKVKADLASAQENISVGNQIIDHMTAEARAAQDKIDTLTAALAQKEAELSDITFRHSQMQNKFRTVADALGLVSAEAVKPVTVAGVTIPSPWPTSDHVSGPSTEASNNEQHSGQSVADPTAQTATHLDAAPGLVATTTLSNPSQDQRDMDPANPTTSPSHSESNTSLHGNNIEQPTTANPSTASAVAAPSPNPTPSTSPTENYGTTSPAADTLTGNAGRSGDGDDDTTRWTSWSNPHHTDHPASA